MVKIFLHYNDLLNDPGFARIKDNNIPSDKSTIRKVLDKAEVQNITKLKEVMNSLFKKKTKHDGFGSVLMIRSLLFTIINKKLIRAITPKERALTLIR